MEPDASALAEATSCLNSCGYAVERVAEAPDGIRPDLLARSSVDSLIVEVKQNVDAELVLDNGVGLTTRQLAYDNSISRVVRKAAAQVNVKSHEADAAVLCYVSTGIDAIGKLEQVKATLYGLVDVLDFTVTTRAQPCFYFDFAEFRRRAELDGALLIGPSGSLLCINEFARRADRLRASQLYEKHHAVDAVCDPAAEELGGRALALREPVDRRNDDERLRHLETKYSLKKLVALRWKGHVGVGFVADE